MKIRVDHLTHYVYEAPLRHSAQYLRLVPQSDSRQRVLEWRLETTGTPLEMRDGFGNVMHLLTMEKPVTEIRLRATGIVETAAAIDEGSDHIRMSPLIFLRASLLAAADAAIEEFAEPFRRRAGTLSGLRDLAAALLTRLPPAAEGQGACATAAEAFAAGSGVGQDHAHVFIACCRYMGIPARYVSGYVCSPPDPDSPAAVHAWAEAWVVDRWRSFDVTNGGPAGERHIRVAVAPDYLAACPVRGVRSGGGTEKMSSVAIVGPEP